MNKKLSILIILCLFAAVTLQSGTFEMVDSVSKAKGANIGNALLTDTIEILNSDYRAAWIALGVGSYGTTMSSDSAVIFTVNITPYLHSLSDTLGGGNVFSTDYTCAKGGKLDTVFVDTLISPNTAATDGLAPIYQRFIIEVKNKQVDKTDSDSASVKAYYFREPRE